MLAENHPVDVIGDVAVSRKRVGSGRGVRCQCEFQQQEVADEDYGEDGPLGLTPCITVNQCRAGP